MEDPVVLLRASLCAGLSLGEALKQLKLAGANPVEAIKAVREVEGVSLGEAKRLFSESSAWSKELRAAAELHDDLFSLKGWD